MQCVKTGCHIFLEEYQKYAVGDAYEVLPGLFIFRLCEDGFKPLRDHLHFTVRAVVHWFDDYKTSPSSNSTLIATSVVDHGYEGTPL